MYTLDHLISSLFLEEVEEEENVTDALVVSSRCVFSQGPGRNAVLPVSESHPLGTSVAMSVNCRSADTLWLRDVISLEVHRSPSYLSNAGRNRLTARF